MPNISEFLRNKDQLAWARFLKSEEGQRGLSFLRRACPRSKQKTDADLIRNCVGFDFWHEAVDAMESLGEITESPEKNDTHEPLE